MGTGLDLRASGWLAVVGIIFAAVVAACGQSHDSNPPSATDGAASSHNGAPSDATTNGADGSGGTRDARQASEAAQASDASSPLDSTVADAPVPTDDGGAQGNPLCPSNVICGGHCASPSDIHHCGACTTDCSDLPQIVSDGLACVSGKCVYRCASGFGDCADGGAGCVDDLTGGGACGACAFACDGGASLCAPAPDAGAFACAAACPASAPTTCGTSCVDTTSSRVHCGSCNRPCVTNIAHAHATCVSGQCSYECDPGYTACNGACVDFASDPLNCGGCGASFACSAPMRCAGGACSCPAMCGQACIDPQVDPKNCGACGHDCLGGTCSGGACQPIALATGMSSPWCLTVDSAGVYWTNNGDGTVMRVGLDGAGLTTLVSGLSMPFGIAVDATSVYFIESNISTVLKAPKSTLVDGGSPPTTLVAGVFRNQYRAIALNSTQLYWSDDLNGGGIYGVAFDGGAVSTLASDAPNSGCHLAIDSSHIYWVAYPGQNAVESAPLDGGPTMILWQMLSSVGDTAEIAVDSDRVYWTELTTGSVRSVLLDGGAPSTLASGGWAEGVAVDATRVYWSASASIQSVPKGGGPVTTLATGQGLPHDLAIDERAIYWTNRGDGTVMKLAK